MKKVLFLAILSVCAVFGEISPWLHKDFIGEEAKARLVALYEDGCSGPNTVVYKSLVSDLDIELSIDEIEKRFEKYGVIQFREVDKRSLVIGSDNPDQKKYSKNGFITISSDFTKNPTIVGFFGETELDILPTGSFDQIIIDKNGITKLPYGVSELKRLLSCHGKLYRRSSPGLDEVSIEQLKKSDDRSDDVVEQFSSLKQLCFAEEKKLLDDDHRLFYRMITPAFPEYIGHDELRNEFIRVRKRKHRDGAKIFDTILAKVRRKGKFTKQERKFVSSMAFLLLEEVF